MAIPNRASSIADQQDGTNRFTIPLAFVAILTVAFAFPYFAVPWPFGDVYQVLLKAESLDWRGTFVKAFNEGAEYRPLFMLVVKALYDTVGLHLWFYKVLVLAQFASILWLFVQILRPQSTHRVIAAVLAVACVAGLHTSRILFSFFPLNHHSLSTLLLLLAVAFVMNSKREAVEWPIFFITLAALFLIEFGLLVAPVLTVLWFARAPKATSRAVAASWIALAIYLAIRFGISPQEDLGGFHAESGIGFSIMELDDLQRTFARAPYLFWAYNIVANVLTVMCSEPRSGMYYFVQSLLRDNTQDWLWLHVLSSVLTTACIVWALCAWRAIGSRDRQLVALGVALMIFGSGLGLLYVRDRVALPVGVGYGVLLYVAAAGLLERTSSRPFARVVVSFSLVAMLACWLVRDAEAGHQIRDTAWERHVEWTERFAELGGLKEERTDLLDQMQSAALSMATPSPRHDALWTYSLFERRVKPED